MSPANPPAFPSPDQDGMTLRDYLAGQIVGHLAAEVVDVNDAAKLAVTSYTLADTMLVVREATSSDHAGIDDSGANWGEDH